MLDGRKCSIGKEGGVEIGNVKLEIKIRACRRDAGGTRCRQNPKAGIFGKHINRGYAEDYR
jgi:hypothetical protein